MDITQFLAALVVAMLATLICLALYDGLRGSVEQPSKKVLAVEGGILCLIVVTMLSLHLEALGWGAYVGSIVAFLAMIVIHDVGNPENHTTPRPAPALVSARRTQ